MLKTYIGFSFIYFLCHRRKAILCCSLGPELSRNNLLKVVPLQRKKSVSLLRNPVYKLFLCQLTCQSADIMSSLCGVGVRVRVRVRVRVNNFSSKTTRPRDVLFFLKDTLSIEDEKLFKACKSVCSSVC